MAAIDNDVVFIDDVLEFAGFMYFAPWTTVPVDGQQVPGFPLSMSCDPLPVLCCVVLGEESGQGIAEWEWSCPRPNDLQSEEPHYTKKLCRHRYHNVDPTVCRDLERRRRRTTPKLVHPDNDEWCPNTQCQWQAQDPWILDIYRNYLYVGFRFQGEALLIQMTGVYRGVWKKESFEHCNRASKQLLEGDEVKELLEVLQQGGIRVFEGLCQEQDDQCNAFHSLRGLIQVYLNLECTGAPRQVVKRDTEGVLQNDGWSMACRLKSQ